MKKSCPKFIIAALVAALFYGCYKPKTYPNIPSIQFVSLTKERSVLGVDSISVITVSFTDGDGDLGYYPAGNGYPYDDTLSVYYDDFVVSFFEKKSGVWIKDTHDTLPNGLPAFSGRMPYLTPEGNNKALSGNISMSQILLPGVRNDTIHYQVYIYDRALHQSNTITTSDIVITTF